jgi:hypothetical protein
MEENQKVEISMNDENNGNMISSPDDKKNKFYKAYKYTSRWILRVIQGIIIGAGAILPGISGLLAGAGVCIAGSMHYPIYKWIIPAYQKLKGIEPTRYWFPDATRYIGYNPETTDKTIHEFPAYSFVLGDLHAHVINIPFVLTMLALILCFVSKSVSRIQDDGI